MSYRRVVEGSDLLPVARGDMTDESCMYDRSLRFCKIISVRTAQFDTILNEPLVIIIQMRVNTCLPESVLSHI